MLELREKTKLNLDWSKIAPILSQEGDESSDEEHQSGVATANEVKRPVRYKVLLHNDDFTTMEFVIYVLQKHFKKTFEEATAVMMKVHKDGVGICGVYTHEVAETKAKKVSKEAKDNGHPLLCTIEPEK